MLLCGMGGPGWGVGLQRRLDSRKIAVLVLGLLLLTGVTGTEEEKTDTETYTDSECEADSVVSCSSSLLAGQFLCLHLEVDPVTQQPKDCQLVNGTGKVKYNIPLFALEPDHKPQF